MNLVHVVYVALARLYHCHRIFHCVTIYPFHCWWTHGLFPANNAAMHILKHVFCYTCTHISLRYHLGGHIQHE